MSSATASKGDRIRKLYVDAASWMFNVVTSVGIILVNKALMATHGFTFGIPSSSFFQFSPEFKKKLFFQQLFICMI